MAPKILIQAATVQLDRPVDEIAAVNAKLTTTVNSLHATAH